MPKTKRQQPKKNSPRSRINKRMHGFFDHPTLSDMARIKFGVGSMRELDDDQMRELYEHVIDVAHPRPRARSPKPKARRPPTAPASPGQIWKINDLRGEIDSGYNMTDDRVFNKWAAGSLGVFCQAPEFKNLTNGQAYGMIEALKKMTGRRPKENTNV